MAWGGARPNTGGARAGAGAKSLEQKATLPPPAYPPPSPGDPVVIEQARKLAELGATDVEIADFFKISVTTLYEWRCRFAEFAQATRIGKDAADDRVERAMFQRSVGYTFDSEKIFLPAGARRAVRVPIREHVPPDVPAARHWLANRRPKDWREKVELSIRHDEAEMTDAELAAVIASGRSISPPETQGS